MEKLSITKFEKVSYKLRKMKIDTETCLIFPETKYKTVTGTIWRLKSEGMKFTTRKLHGNVHVWRVA